MDPSLIMGLIGGVSGLFGRGRSGPNYQQMMFDRYNGILDEAMRIYKTTDFDAIDQGSIETFKKTSQDEAETAMGNYSAKMSAAGFGPGFSDTEKTRSLGRFAKEAAKDSAAFESDLMRTRPQRKAALLPNPGAVAGGFDMASRLDSFRDNLANSEFQSLLQLGQSLAPMLRRGRSPAPIGRAPMGDLSLINEGSIPDLSFLFSGNRGRL